MEMVKSLDITLVYMYCPGAGFINKVPRTNLKSVLGRF